MKKEEKENILAFINHMANVTVRIVIANKEGKLKGMNSGFIYQPDLKKNPIVITAGHGMPKRGAFIETSFKKEGHPLLINGGEFKVLHKDDEIDYAYSELPLQMTVNDLEEDIQFESLIYRHKFVKAKKSGAYGFAVINNDLEFIKNGDDLILPTYMCYEIDLELVKQEERVNYFKPLGEIKDHKYYRGASGSPIADPEGAITSILIGGTKPKELLRAFRLDNIKFPV